MKVAIDARYAETKLVGVGNYIVNLTKTLADLGVEFILFYSRAPEYPIKHRNIKYQVLKTSNSYYFEQVLLAKAIIKNEADLFHAAGNLGVPITKPVPTIVTLHDTIPFELPNYFKYSKFPLISKNSYYFRENISLKLADRIIVLSKFQKNRLMKLFKVDKDKIRIIASGVNKMDKTGNLPRGIEKKSYILNNGGIDLRKNLDNLIMAFSQICQNFPNIKLIITGENRAELNDLKKLAKRLKIKDKVIFTGYVKESRLWSLISNAKCVCYPSLMEGFGQPILEGFEAGVPVITSNITSMPEIAGKAAKLVNPNDKNEIAKALRDVLTDDKVAKEMIKKGYKKVAEYSWAKTAKKTLGIYNQLMV